MKTRHYYLIPFFILILVGCLFSGIIYLQKPPPPNLMSMVDEILICESFGKQRAIQTEKIWDINGRFYIQDSGGKVHRYFKSEFETCFTLAKESYLRFIEESTRYENEEKEGYFRKNFKRSLWIREEDHPLPEGPR